MDPGMSWLDDELSALNDAESAMNESIDLLVNKSPVFSPSVTQNGSASKTNEVVRTVSKPLHNNNNIKGTDQIVPEPERVIPEPNKPPSKLKSSFPVLDLGTEDTEKPNNGSSDMAQHSISSSTPLATSSRSTNPTKSSKSAEDDLDFYTQSLINNMNNPSDKEMFGYCGKCNGIVEGEKTGCSAMDKIYHIDCFRCKTCNKLLHGEQFFVVEKEGFCEGCYMDSLEKCTVCSEVITDRILRATGKPYHPACFKCVVCGQCLDGIPFTVDVTNQIHCIDDFHQKFAPRCSVCQQPIMPEPGQEETVRIVALDRSFHVNCYKCEKCGTKLTSEKEGKGCFPLDGHILCRDCNTAMVQELSQKI